MSSALVSGLENAHTGWQLFKAIAPEQERVLTLWDDKVALPVMVIIPWLYNPQIAKLIKQVKWQTKSHLPIYWLYNRKGNEKDQRAKAHVQFYKYG